MKYLCCVHTPDLADVPSINRGYQVMSFCRKIQAARIKKCSLIRG